MHDLTVWLNPKPMNDQLKIHRIVKGITKGSPAAAFAVAAADSVADAVVADAAIVVSVVAAYLVYGKNIVQLVAK